MWTNYLVVDAKVAALPRHSLLAPVVGFHILREQADEQDAYYYPSGNDLKRFSWKTPFESKTLSVECQSSSVFKTITISHYITIHNSADVNRGPAVSLKLLITPYVESRLLFWEKICFLVRYHFYDNNFAMIA